MPELTDLDREVLAIEALWFEFPGVKEQVIRERTKLSATRYYQHLNALLDTEPALAYAPLVVRRLRRLRDRRQLSRPTQRQA